MKTVCVEFVPVLSVLWFLCIRKSFRRTVVYVLACYLGFLVWCIDFAL